MDALLAALAEPAPKRTKIIVAGGVVGVLAGVGIVVYAMQPARSTATPGDGPAAPVAWAGADVANHRVLTTAGCDDSPVIDGSTVVFGRTKGNNEVDLYSIPLAGGAERQLTKEATWEWRPNVGRRAGEIMHIVHNGRTSEGATIASLDLATGVSTTAAAAYAWDALVIGGAIMYTPDDPSSIRRIVDKRDLPFVDPRAGEMYLLVTPSPTGDRVATMRSTLNGGPINACAVDLATRAIVCSKTHANLSRPAFGADGRTLYFSGRDGLRRFDIATGDESMFMPDVWSDGGVAVAPDGSALVYSMCRGNYSIVDVTATPHEVWIEGPFALEIAVASTGATAWVSEIKGIQILQVRTADGREIQLTDVDFGSIQAPVFSHDGKQILFGGSGAHPGLFTLRLSNPGAPYVVTSDPRDTGPVWTPGGVIGFTRAIGGTSFAFAIGKDGAARQLSTRTRFVYGNRGEELLVDSGDPETDSLRWLDIATGAERAGPARPEGFIKAAVTSPDGGWIGLLMGFNGQDVWRIRVEPPGPPEQVHVFTGGLTASSIAMTNDGKVLVTKVDWDGGLHVVPAKPGARF